MGFAKAQPPAALHILTGAAEKLGKESGEFFNRTSQCFARKQRAEQRIAVYAGIKCRCELAAGFPAPKGFVQRQIAEPPET
jgi:hypothetical protein